MNNSRAVYLTSIIMVDCFVIQVADHNNVCSSEEWRGILVNVCITQLVVAISNIVY